MAAVESASRYLNLGFGSVVDGWGGGLRSEVADRQESAMFPCSENRVMSKGSWCGSPAVFRNWLESLATVCLSVHDATGRSCRAAKEQWDESAPADRQCQPRHGMSSHTLTLTSHFAPAQTTPPYHFRAVRRGFASPGPHFRRNRGKTKQNCCEEGRVLNKPASVQFPTTPSRPPLSRLPECTRSRRRQST